MKADIIKKVKYVAVDCKGVEYPLSHFNGSKCDGYSYNELEHSDVNGTLVTKQGKDKIYFNIK
jgi:hypothetical protein